MPRPPRTTFLTRLTPQQHLAAGVRGHRIGVFFANADPYLRLIHEHFGSAGVEFAGEQCHTLRRRPAARSLRRLLSIDTDVMPRRELLSILSERAVTWYYGTPISALQFRRVERLTRARVEIVGGSDWERLTELDPEDRDANVATALHSLVTTLRDDLNAVAYAARWSEASRCVVDVLGRCTERTTGRW